MGTDIGTKDESGCTLIARECVRVRGPEENWSEKHDREEHSNGELAWAAVCYAAPVRIFIEIRDRMGQIFFMDPFPHDWSDKRVAPGNQIPSPESIDGDERIRMLVRAGQFVAAEIDRLQALRK